MKRVHLTKVNSVSEYLKANGIGFELRQGSKHVQMALTFEGTTRRITLSGDEDNNRGLQNFRAQVRRMADGLKSLTTRAA